MQARRKTRLYIVLAVLAGLGLTVSLTLYALSSNIDLFYTPGEIIYGKTETRALPHTGQRLRVGGYVQPGSTLFPYTTLFRSRPANSRRAL